MLDETLRQLRREFIAAAVVLGTRGDIDQMNANAQMPKPLALTDRQLRLIQTAARAVPVERRDLFLQNVAKHLTSEPTDSAVIAALNAQLDYLPRFFLCDSKGANK